MKEIREEIYYTAKNKNAKNHFRILGLDKYIIGEVENDLLHIKATTNNIGGRKTPIFAPLIIKTSLLRKITNCVKVPPTEYRDKLFTHNTKKYSESMYKFDSDLKLKTDNILFYAGTNTMKKAFRDLHLLKFVSGVLDDKGMFIVTSTRNSLSSDCKVLDINKPIKLNFNDLLSTPYINKYLYRVEKRGMNPLYPVFVYGSFDGFQEALIDSDGKITVTKTYHTVSPSDLIPVSKDELFRILQTIIERTIKKENR